MWTVNISFWDDYLDPLKVTFDGQNRQIIVNPQYNSVSVKIDIYSAAKRWLQRRQNSGFLPPLRSIGGDPIVGGIYAGDIYFLLYDWQIVLNHPVTVIGSIYHDNVTLSPFIINSGGGVQSTVSNLTYAYNTVGAIVPTAADVATEVWSTDPSVYATGTAANKINKLDKIKTNTDNILALSV